MDSRRTVFLGSIVLALCSWNPAKADIRYVDWSATGSGSGASWENAYTSVSDALAREHSSDFVDEVWVSDGIYRASETDINASFQLQRLVSIYGGFEGTEETRAERGDPSTHETILSGQLGSFGRSLVIVKGEVGDETAILDGFTITGGRQAIELRGSSPTLNLLRIESNGEAGVVVGAGMYIQAWTIEDQWVGSSPPISNCALVSQIGGSGSAMFIQGPGSNPTVVDTVFSANQADSDGGAVWISFQSNDPPFTNQAAPTFVRCRFENNSAGSAGGAIFNESPGTGGGVPPRFTECEFLGNYVSSPGGITRGGGGIMTTRLLTCRRCYFDTNWVRYGDGGAVLADDHSGARLLDSNFWGNYALVKSTSETDDERGGGAVAANWECEIFNCTFSFNYSLAALGPPAVPDAYGGAVLARELGAKIVNSTFTYNGAGWGGGVGSLKGSPQLTNCTLVWNSATHNGGGLHVEIAPSGTTPTVVNSIFWENWAVDALSIADEQVTIPESSNGAVRFSCIYDEDPYDEIIPFNGAMEENRNIDDYPEFYDPSHLNWSLTACSKCVDAALRLEDEDDPTIPPKDSYDIDEDAEQEERTPDLERHMRDVDHPPSPNTGEGEPYVDMGASEYQRRGDMNFDRRLDGDDLDPFVQCYLSGTGITGENCELADMDEDLDIDDDDVNCIVGELTTGVPCESACAEEMMMSMMGGGGAAPEGGGGEQESGEQGMGMQGGVDSGAGSGEDAQTAGMNAAAQAYLAMCMTGTDCNGNGRNDACDLRYGARPHGGMDCNDNGVLDECDIAAGVSEDANANGFPDECDAAVGLTSAEIASADSAWASLTRAERMARRAALSEWINRQHWGPSAESTAPDQFEALIAKTRDCGVPLRGH